MVDLRVDVGISIPATPSSTRYVFMISSPSTTRSPSSVVARRHRRCTRVAYVTSKLEPKALFKSESFAGDHGEVCRQVAEGRAVRGLTVTAP